MNPNAQYGQPMPMQPPPRRHDGSYAPLPPHLRPHPNYQPYYPQQMGPMMPQYPQHYAPNWYSYQQQQMHPYHQPRPHYYHQPHAAPPQYQQHHVPMVAPPQHSHMQPSPRPAPVPGALLPQQAPSSTSTSSAAPVQTPPSPPLSTSSTSISKKESPIQSASPEPQRVQSPSIETVAQHGQFFPPVPWLSFEGEKFPPRAPRRRRRIPRSLLAAEPKTYPLPEETTVQEQPPAEDTTTPKASEGIHDVPTPVGTPTPQASDAPSEALSTQPTTPSSVAGAPVRSQQTPTQSKSRTAGPVIPVVPVLPQSPSATRRTHRDSNLSAQSKASDITPTSSAERRSSVTSVAAPAIGNAEVEEGSKPVSPPAAPKSWANLFKSSQVQNSTAPNVVLESTGSGLAPVRGETMSDVLNDMSADAETPSKIGFLQPRGLVNTGNMCYMNSVLQVLVFCNPFYDFLARIASRAPHTFKSDTLLIDAIILFVQEYPVIDSATSVEQLRLRLNPDDYEKYGEPFIPEYVYSAIKQLPRFREMRRGHQQDAQEFLGFLLEELHEECARAMRTGTSISSGMNTPLGNPSTASEAGDNESGWMEVGHRQKSAVTRSSGAIVTESPVTNIFGGKLRSELKISGNKLSVTLEPYSPLQLDIGSPEVNNIVDALKGLTRPESMQGDFQSARGQKATATKQVFIETLPPVLILHLKRFHYDSTTKRAEKIWKQVGYPLELEIPKEVFPTQVRNKFAAHGGLPKYRLTGVIYHHGKNANGGHYTVDIRRQDGREWIRIDDTLIRRIRSEDVAEGGSEEDPKLLAAALERHRQGKTSENRFEHIDQDEEDEGRSDKVWSQVNGHSRSKSTINAIVNGTANASRDASGPQTPRERYQIKDNKVAYLLFYQRITA